MRLPFRLVGAATAGVLVSSACAGVSANVAATVDGADIPVAQVEQLVRARLEAPQFADMPADQRVAQTDALQQQVVASLVTQELLRVAAAERGVEPTQAELDEAWDLQVAAIGGEEALPQALADAGLTEEQAREQVAATVRQRKLQESFDDSVEVSEAELQELYEQQLPQLETVDTAHILVETEEEAEAIIGLLEDGADFADLATARSIDPSAQQNAGELGPVAVGQLVPEYVEPLRDAEPGDIVGPVQTQFGWHVIRFGGFDTPSLDEVRGQLRSQLAGGRSGEDLNAYLTDLLERIEVQINSRFGTWDPQTGTVVPPEGVGTGSGPSLVDGGAGAVGGEGTEDR